MAATASGPSPTSVSRTAPDPGLGVVFAGAVLVMAGIFSVLWGLAAVLNDDVVRAP
jgi:hypothetical protein